MDTENRYDRARRLGIEDRAIHLPRPPHLNDALSEQAEEFFLARYGEKPEDLSRLERGRYTPTCDYRYDFWTKKAGKVIACLDIKWTPVPGGHLMVEKEKVGRHRCLVYVLVTGEPDKGDPFTFRGWVWGHHLIETLRQPGAYECPHCHRNTQPRKEAYVACQEQMWKNPDILMAATFGGLTPVDAKA